MDVTGSAEPWEEAREVIERLLAALEGATELVDEAERQVRNARMTDALELGPDELREAYPEAVDEHGRLYAHVDLQEMLPRPQDEPYQFWSLTRDAGLIARIAGALRTVIGLAERLLSEQPPVRE